MRKIRGFKLNLRIKEVQRLAKKAKLDLAALGLGTEPSLQALLDQVIAASRPAVLFDTFAAGSAAADASALAPVPGLACTLTLATLGPDLDAWAASQTEASPERRPLLDLVARVALEDAVRFVLGLVEEEAEEEAAQLSPLQYITERSALEAVLARLEGHKIGVAMGEDGLRPACSLAFSVSWVAARSKSRAK